MLNREKKKKKDEKGQKKKTVTMRENRATGCKLNYCHRN